MWFPGRESTERWEVEPGARALVERARLLLQRDRHAAPSRLKERPDRSAQLVKRSHVRTVWRVAHGESVYYVKSFTPTGLAAWSALLGRPGKGWREYRQLRRLRARGVDCPRPVACGEERRLGRTGLHLLITEELAGSVLLEEAAFDAELPAESRRRLAWGFGRWLRELHDAGVYHADFHGGNVAVTRTEEGYRFALLDVDRVRLRRRLSRRLSEEMLAAAEAYVQHAVPTSLRLLALKGYLDCPGRLDAGGRRLARRVWRRSRRRLERFWRHRLERAFQTNRQFAVGRLGPRRFALRTAGAGGMLKELLTDPEQLLMLPDLQVLKSSRRAVTALVRVGEGLSGDQVERRWVVKRYKPPVGLKLLASAWRSSRAWRSWRRANELTIRRLPVPRPVAAVEVRRRGLLQDAYYVCEAIAGDRLLEFIRAHGFDPEVMWKLGRMLRGFHDQCFYHQDLKANNVMVSGGPGDRQVWLIDLESVHRRSRDSRRRRLKQLGRLWRHIAPVRTLEPDAIRTFVAGYLHPARRRSRMLRQWTEDIVVAAAPGRKGVATPRRILLVKPSSLGDVVHSFPVAVALKEAFPEAELHWVVSRPYAELVKAHPAVDRVHVFERRRWSGRGFWTRRREWKALVRGLRAARFDVAIDLQGLARSAVLSRLSGAPVRIGLAGAREFSRLFYTTVARRPEGTSHAVERYLRVLPALGVALPERPRFGLAAPEEARRRVGELLSEELVGENILCVAPGARWSSKRWSPERFAEAAGALAEKHDLRVIVVGTEEDGPLAAPILERLGDRALDWTGRTSLTELVALFERAKLLLTNDSGPMHLAAALETPLVAVFGPTSPRLTGPHASRASVVAALTPCAPCYRRQCDRLTCLLEVRVEEVVRRAEVSLAGQAQQAETEEVEVS